MALITLENVRTRTPDKYFAAIIDDARKDLALETMVFDDNVQFQGSSLFYGYSRVNAKPKAGFRAINGKYTNSGATTEPVSVQLKPLGSKDEIDRVIIENMQNSVSGLGELDFQIQQHLEATKMAFSDALINGDASADPNAFNGLNKLVDASMDFTDGIIDLTAGTADADEKFLTVLDKAMASMGRKNLIYVPTLLTPALNRIARRSNLFDSTRNNFGVPITSYNNTMFIPMGEDCDGNDIIAVDEGNGTVSIYIAYVALDGVHAVAGVKDIIKTYIPDLNNMAAEQQLIGTEMVTSIALKSKRALAKIGGIKIK